MSARRSRGHLCRQPIDAADDAIASKGSAVRKLFRIIVPDEIYAVRNVVNRKRLARCGFATWLIGPVHGA